MIIGEFNDQSTTGPDVRGAVTDKAAGSIAIGENKRVFP